jgi:stage II sporulation protein M
LPVVTILIFGISIGLVFSANNLSINIDQSSLLLSILPHSIFEIPAIIYASSIGIFSTIQTSKMIIPRVRSKATSFRALCKEAGRSFVLIVVPLLTVAALVEAFITPVRL